MLRVNNKNSSPAQNREVVWQPQPGSQVLFLDSPVRETLYAGSRGPGKTDALLMDFAQDVGKGWGAEWQGILFRETYLQLADVIKKTKKWFPRIWPKAVYNKSDRVWTWPTGESLRLAYMNDPEDYWNYHGHAYPWIGWEELCNWISPDCYTVMMSCNRSTVKGIPRKIRATTNPYGKGHNWVRKRWRLPEMFGRIVREYDDNGNPLPERIAIHGSILENKILLDADPEYISNLRAAARNPEELKAWLHGSWDIVSGGAFDDLWDPKVHVIPRSPIPANWRVFRSYDWGSSRPFSVGWWAEANGDEIKLSDGRTFAPPRGSLIRIAEWYGTKELGTNKGLLLSSARQAEGIKEREYNLRNEGWIKGRVMAGPADNSIFDKNPDSDSIAAIMESHGVFWERSNKNPGSRERGLELIRQRLENAVNREGPGLYFMPGCWQTAQGCDASIELLPRLPRDEKNPDDIDTDAEDHFYDEIRYTVLDANDRYPVGLKITFPS